LGVQPDMGLSISGSEVAEVELLRDALTDAGLKPSKVSIEQKPSSGTNGFTELFVGPREAPSIVGHSHDAQPVARSP
jgi:hypothetical protein